MQTISLKINSNLQKLLESKAKELNTSTNDLITKAVNDFLHFEKIKRIRSKLKKTFIKKGIKSENDLFNAIS